MIFFLVLKIVTSKSNHRLGQKEAANKEWYACLEIDSFGEQAMELRNGKEHALHVPALLVIGTGCSTLMTAPSFLYCLEVPEEKKSPDQMRYSYDAIAYFPHAIPASHWRSASARTAVSNRKGKRVQDVKPGGVVFCAGVKLDEDFGILTVT